jgi:hypothetical protein
LVATEAGTGQRYATQVGRLWSGLTGTLARLDAFAAEPSQLEDDEAPAMLRGLQYRLHVACERAYGLAPPFGAEPIHAELAAALEGAREATAEMVETLELDGAEAAQLLVHEWRGALFRVRLARLRLAGPRPQRPVPVEPQCVHRAAALTALVLALTGALVFAVGASAGAWPVWAAGIAGVCASFIAYKP